MTDRDTAIQFMGTMRGQFILGQALELAIETLESVEPEEMRELSNISDMRLIRDNLFRMGAEVTRMRREHE